MLRTANVSKLHWAHSLVTKSAEPDRLRMHKCCISIFLPLMNTWSEKQQRLNRTRSSEMLALALAFFQLSWLLWFCLLVSLKATIILLNCGDTHWMAMNALVDSFCHNQKKCGIERVNNNHQIATTSYKTQYDSIHFCTYMFFSLQTCLSASLC